MTTAAWGERSETSLASNTRFEQQNMTAILRVLEIIVGLIFFYHPVDVMTQDSGVVGVLLIALRCSTRQSRATFGHRSGYPEALWPISSPLTPLIWVVKVSVTIVAD